MKIELSDLNKGSVIVGEKLISRAKFTFEEDMSLRWAGVRLITKPPCTRALQIAKTEIFSRGSFEAGTYIRDKPIQIKKNIVPTIKKRDLNYHLELLLRQKNPINPEEDLLVKREREVKIEPRKRHNTMEANPISFSISGLNVNLTKDVFKPGETIKINYSSKNLKQIEVRLLQKANLVCYCEKYGRNCTNVEDLPPAIAGDVKTSNTQKGFLLLKVPEKAEPTHDYLWESLTEREHWGIKFGDYSKWSLLVIGRKKPEYGRERITFEVPIVISKEALKEEKKELDLFSKTSSGGMNIFEEAPSRFQKVLKLVSLNPIEKSNTKNPVLRLTYKNISKDDMEGVTLKISGLQEGLFETKSRLRGFSTWKAGEEKIIDYEMTQKISALITEFENNRQNKIRLQAPI